MKLNLQRPATWKLIFSYNFQADLLGKIAVEKLENTNIVTNTYMKYQEASWEGSKSPVSSHYRTQPFHTTLLEERGGGARQRAPSTAFEEARIASSTFNPGPLLCPAAPSPLTAAAAPAQARGHSGERTIVLCYSSTRRATAFFRQVLLHPSLT